MAGRNRTAADRASKRQPAGRAARFSRQNGPIRRAVVLLGPGLVAGVADDDPSSIGTCAVAGASWGFGTLWWIAIHLPLTVAVQVICARLAMVSGRGLTENLLVRYPRTLVYGLVVAVVAANVFTLGADLGAIADAVKIMVSADVKWLIPAVSAGILALQIFASYDVISTVFKWLAVALLAYVVDAIVVRPDVRAMFVATLLPRVSLDKEYLTTVVAVIGTFLSPFVFFWQSDEEVEEEKQVGRRTVAAREGASPLELRVSWLDITIGMTFSTLISYVIVVATAMTLFAHGQRHIETGAQAAQALQPIAGKAAGLLFAAGMIGTGLLTVPVLSSTTGFMLAQLRGWRHGLSEPWRRARRFYTVILLATGAGVAMNFVGLNPITALVWSSVLCSIVMPPLLYMVIRSGRDPRIMADQTISPSLAGLGWAALAVLSLTLVAFAYVTLLK